MDTFEQLTGIVEKIIFASNESGFVVLTLSHDRITTTVTGHLPNVQPGQHVSLTGTWGMHPKFGKQFEAQQATLHAPTSITGLKKYLGSGLIKGIGPAYAEKLVDHFGTEILDIIDSNPKRLAQVPGIGAKRIETITVAWRDQKAISHIMVFLQERGVSPFFAIKIYKQYGAESIARITQNPYRLADDIWGVGFKTADQIAIKLGFALDCAQRITAGIVYALSQTITLGSIYTQVDELKQKTVELLGLEQDSSSQTLTHALHELYRQEKIKLITVENQHFLTLSQYYFAEKGTAQKILKLMDRPCEYAFDIDTLYNSLRTSTDQIELNDDQIRSIVSCVQQKITIITGGPGTGKTTLIKKLLQVLDTHKRSYKLAAPTGRAAKRMQEGTARPASTLHRLLEFDPMTMGFSRNEQNALVLDILIIDEASMIDIFLAYAVLKALPSHAQLILIGDIDQLPSVGAGNVLHDLIASQKVPAIRLTHIFRQAQNSMIICNAHRINNGEFPVSWQEGSRKDFIFIKEEDAQQLNIHLQQIYSGTLARHGINHADATVLTPMNRGIVGTQQINAYLQHLLNATPTTSHVTSAGTTFKVHDRVMQIRNNYDKLVFNGDIGTITEIDTQEKEIMVNFFERMVIYDFSELDELTLAYAITVHKSQGSEYAAAIIPIFMQHFTLLQRNLLYTAITRAKKLCILIGQPKAIAMAIKNTKGTERITFLKHYLTTDLTCR